MWEFLTGFFFARATGLSRIMRPLLVLFFFGCLVAGVIYACVVFKAISERSQTPHVHAHSTH
jgi:hypothetical protein